MWRDPHLHKLVYAEPEDIEAALHAIADGKTDVTPWLGPTIGLSGVAEALEGLANPTNPIRTVVDPRKI